MIIEEGDVILKAQTPIGRRCEGNLRKGDVVYLPPGTIVEYVAVKDTDIVFQSYGKSRDLVNDRRKARFRW